MTITLLDRIYFAALALMSIGLCLLIGGVLLAVAEALLYFFTPGPLILIGIALVIVPALVAALLSVLHDAVPIWFY